jgi:hypothetical protein
MNHEAIYRSHPNVVTIDSVKGAFDADGNQIDSRPNSCRCSSR